MLMKLHGFKFLYLKLLSLKGFETFPLRVFYDICL